MANNNIDFSIIRERALRNIREDLLAEFAGQSDALEITDAFDAVVRNHKRTATVEDFIPVLVEAEMRDRLRTDSLLAAA